jgi:hypothetical protein
MVTLVSLNLVPHFVHAGGCLDQFTRYVRGTVASVLEYGTDSIRDHQIEGEASNG